MSNNNQEVETQQIIAINFTGRWQVYYRLQELEIPCQCATNQPLQIKINNPKTAIQLWSVVKQFTEPRHELVRWLESCWNIDFYQSNN
jgi:hypothetical protein